jgi:hypothetical protein
MNKGKKSKKMMAGGRAGIKKMMAGGRAGMKKMKAGGSADDKKLLTQEQMKAIKKIIGKTKGTISNKELDLFMKSAPKLKSATAAKKIVGKTKGPTSNKERDLFKRMVESKKSLPKVKKMMGGGRSGPVKMMKGGDPLSPRGAKMGMVMSPSKNKGKGLYGK